MAWRYHIDARSGKKADAAGTALDPSGRGV
jgi:hypothetical protein